MKIAQMLAVGVLGMGLSLAAVAQEGPPGGPPTTRPMRGQGGQRGGAVPNGLGGAMRDMGQMYKVLKADAADPAKMDESLHNVQTMERDVSIAKLNPPPTVRNATGDDKVKKTEDFRTDMSDLMKTLLSLEDSIAAKNADDINKGLDAIKAAMDKGHGEFIPKREG